MTAALPHQLPDSDEPWAAVVVPQLFVRQCIFVMVDRALRSR